MASSECERHGAAAWIWLNRPDVHNAFDGALVDELTSAFLELGCDKDIRAIVLAARGKSFCAGAQAQWMRQQGAATAEENATGARRLATLFDTIANSPKPTIARVQGAAIGGGLGLIAACDIAIASSGALFAASEVRLGLIPATIAPYVIRAIGERHARRLFLTGERIDAIAAQAMGLVHEAIPPEHLDGRLQTVLADLLSGAPGAQREAKQLIEAVANRPLTRELLEDTARRIASRRADTEASEGLAAFLEKRRAAWVVKP